MKTASKNSTKRKTSRSNLSTGKKPKNTPRKNIENTDLNVDDDRTNADNSSDDEFVNNSESDPKKDSKAIDPRITDDTSVEEEQDREALRKMEDNHPDEILN